MRAVTEKLRKLSLVANTLAAAVAYNVRKSVIHDLNIRIINRNTGELLRQLTLNPDRDYQPQPKNWSLRVYVVRCF